MECFIANRQRAKAINTGLVQQIARTLLADLAIADAELGINLVGRRQMTRINEKFLRHAGATDVITFSYPDSGRAGHRVPASVVHGELRPALRGEIFICVSEVEIQSRQFSTTWQSEMVRCLIHGILHLLGYDDRRPAARRRMRREEDRCLRALARKFCLAQIARP